VLGERVAEHNIPALYHCKIIGSVLLGHGNRTIGTDVWLEGDDTECNPYGVIFTV